MGKVNTLFHENLKSCVFFLAQQNFSLKKISIYSCLGYGDLRIQIFALNSSVTEMN